MRQGEIDYELIGRRIREKRQAAKLTQEQLAEKLDVAPEYVSRVENGRAQINLKRLGQLSALLGVPIEYFVAGSAAGADEELQALLHTASALTPRQRTHLLRIAQEIEQLAQEC